jgi:hypothetical protein
VIHSRISIQGHTILDGNPKLASWTLEYPGFRLIFLTDVTRQTPSFDRVNKVSCCSPTNEPEATIEHAQSGNDILRLRQRPAGSFSDYSDAELARIGLLLSLPRHLCGAGLEGDFPAEKIEIRAPSLFYPTSRLPKHIAPCRPIHHGSRP